MNTKDQILRLFDLLAMDGLSFNMLATYCMIEFRMDYNPIPGLRKYLKKYRVDIPIHYIETERDMDADDILNRVCGRAVPLIVVIATKHKGMAKKVDMRLITNKIWTPEEKEQIGHIIRLI